MRGPASKSLSVTSTSGSVSSFRVAFAPGVEEWIGEECCVEASSSIAVTAREDGTERSLISKMVAWEGPA